jgi:hypothetical protein
MKILSLLILALIFCFTFYSCSKSSTTLNNNNPITGTTTYDSLPKAIQNLVSEAIVDTLKAAGMKINVGNIPPIINGIYLLSPYLCVFENTSTLSIVGDTVDEYKIEFSNQNNTNLTISYKTKDVTNPGVDSSASDSTFITGSGNSFTAYLLTSGTENNTYYTDVEIISGEITSNGISNFQQSLYLRSKVGDPTDTALSAVGTILLYEMSADGTGTAYTTTAYRPALNTSNSEPIRILSRLSPFTTKSK